jgi:cobalamin-dependent methionine synthase I
MTDLAEAAGSVVKRSKEGLYEIPTMELQKLKQIAEATGKNFDDIVQTAKTAAKQNDIGKMLNPRVKGDARDMIKNLAQFNTKSGKFEVTVDGKPMEVAKITKDIEKVKKLKQELKLHNHL